MGNAAPIITVSNVNDQGPGSLRRAILDIEHNGTIFFAQHLSGDTILLQNGPLQIDKNVTIIGPGMYELYLTSNNESRIFIQEDQTQVVIRGVSIINAQVKTGTLDRDSKGGAIYSEGHLIIENCTISGCSSVNAGGGIYGDTLEITNCNILNNETKLYGGGIYCNVLIARNSTISFNRAGGYIEPSRAGPVYRKSCAGGIYGKEQMDIIQCTIVENSCDLHGGGIYFFNEQANHQLSIKNSLIARNSAETGGGIFEELSLISEFNNNIIATNHSSLAAPDFFNGGTWVNPGNVNSNLIGIMESGQLIPGLNNRIGNPINSIDPLIDSLKDNGGITLTAAIMECSPAIDGGTPTGAIQFDQRGFERVVGQSADIGPYEFEDPYNQQCFEHPAYSYVIIADKKVKLKNNNLVQNGGIGVVMAGEKAEIEDSTRIVAPTTFVKAESIDISGGSLVANPIYEVPYVSLPPYIAHMRNGTLDLDINQNDTVIVSDSIFNKITIDKGATAIFTANKIYVEDLDIKDNAVMQVGPCTTIFIEDRLDCGKNSKLNSENNGLKIYAQHAHIEEGAFVVANIYTTTHIRVNGKDDNIVQLYGQFLGEEIEGDDHVIWNWNKGNACPGFYPNEPFDCSDLVVDAGINKGVLYSDRFNFLNRYSCVLMNADVSGGTGPYAYNWEPSIGLSDPSVLRPIACPRKRTEYILTVTDANGCEQKDSVIIEAYNIFNLLFFPRCQQGGAFRIAMCDIETGATICVSLFSSSETNGLGPNLNKGNTLGACSNAQSSPISYKNNNPRSKTEPWPNPSHGSISIPIPENGFIEFELFDITGNRIAIQRNISPSFKGTGQYIELQSLDAGLYFYRILGKEQNYRSGKFTVVK